PPPAPIPQYPQDLATGVPTAPALSWNPAGGAESYRLQVSQDQAFGTTVYDQDGIGASPALVPGLASATQYFWRVRATNTAGNSEWSQTWSFTTASAADALVGHWKTDEGSGNTLSDASVHGNHAQLTGSPERVQGIHGQAIRFTGSGQVATAQDHESLDITGAITMAAWVRPEKTATQYIVRKATPSSTDGYEFMLTSSGKILFRFNQASSGGTYSLSSAASYPTDGSTWVHLAATYDGTTIRIYANGLEDASVTVTPTPIMKNTLPLTIGAAQGGGFGLSGALDDLRIYNAALEPADVMALAALPPPPECGERHD